MGASVVSSCVWYSGEVLVGSSADPGTCFCCVQASNRLQSLEGVGSLTQLTTLHARDNQLSKLDDLTEALQALQYINLRYTGNTDPAHKSLFGFWRSSALKTLGLNALPSAVQLY